MNRFAHVLFWMLISTCPAVFSQCPDNIGFERGDFSGWQMFTGEIARNGALSLSETSQPVEPRLTLMKASDEKFDRYGNFPTVSPNGSGFAVRLGDDNTGRGVDRLIYALSVPNTPQYALILNYAVVLQNPEGHSDVEQPRFAVRVFNETDNKEVECPAFDFIANQNLPGFKISDIVTNNPLPNGGVDLSSIYYKDWTSTTINLQGYAGKKIQLIFTANDCTRGGHFGYAYFDINEQCNNPITGNAYCSNQNFVSLKGPRGFNSYKWYKSDDMTKVLDTTQTLNISPAPPNGTRYSLVVDALPGLGCRDTLNVAIIKSDESFVFKVEPVLYFCKGSKFNLRSPLVTSGSVGKFSLEYYINPITEEYLRDPDKISQSGTYYIKATNSAGCTNTLKVELRYYDEVDLTTSDLKVVYPATADLSKAYTHHSGYKYYYYSNNKLTVPLADFQNINASGKYYIKAISESGCEKIASVNVTIDPPAPFVISAPKAITPNGDGINDAFGLTLEGFIEFGTISIYSRSGQFLYKTNKQSNLWDGNWNGKPLPVGTYYWLFEGTDQYYHTKVTKGGYVSIIK
ncbi:T9SS type B sorting domain-containing protein [Mucilaginibacter auburnensis]|uniref:Gliding motility-associated-like protein n=1 Tax=Mucilaginibacter auburnensis TaxID=1457233 RepID=A0A2H9VM49_9SPHI|nr:gliding motility-associated C-terminal domain-containing protein [Mucilaginibacter auburnensis]PJJ79417.1 gliding motility-associated-like protein [Mucilaginibacter auburnensis]